MSPEWTETLLHAYASHDRVTRFLVEGLDEAAWRAEPAVGRSVACIVAHMHGR